MNEATVTINGVTVIVRAEASDVWAIAKTAIDTIASNEIVEPTIAAKPMLKVAAVGGRSPGRSGHQQMRDIAIEILADGRIHERRELSRAVREAGLNGKNLDGALAGARFEKSTNVMGRPTYRDLEAAPPAREFEKGSVPQWAPAEWDGRSRDLGELHGTNGSSSEPA